MPESNDGPKLSQTESGLSWEFALADAVVRETGARFIVDQNGVAARAAYQKLPPETQSLYSRSASAAISDILSRDNRLGNAANVHITATRTGKSGDVRDVIAVTTREDEIGISAKLSNSYLKHPRLSDKNDWGLHWGGYRVSDKYWSAVKPLFAQLREMPKVKFADIPDKESRFYLPVLCAFEDEFQRLWTEYDGDFIRQYFGFITGATVDHWRVRADFKKARNRPQEIGIQVMNPNGTIPGVRFRYPNALREMIRSGDNHLLMEFNDGWSLDHRLHNADRFATPSLKLESKLESMPVASHWRTIPIPAN